MSSTRRDFLGGTVGAVTATALSARFLEATTARAGAGKTKTGLKVGGCTVGLEEGARCGLDGVEVGVGGPADRLEITRPEVRRQYKDRMEKTGLPISSLMMGLLNDCALATDPRASAWLEQSIDAAHDLGAKVILVAFFANGDLLGSGDRPALLRHRRHRRHPGHGVPVPRAVPGQRVHEARGIRSVERRSHGLPARCLAAANFYRGAKDR
jgi:xylose isomerase-like TIM barrel protein